MNLTSVVAHLFVRGRLPQARARRTSLPVVEALEDRCVPAGFLVTGPTPGFTPLVQSFSANFQTGVLNTAPNAGGQNPYGATPPGLALPAVAVAAGDLDGDGDTDTIAAAFRQPGGVAQVQLFTLNADGSLTAQGASFTAGFAEVGRAFVAFGNLDGADGDELILGTGVDPLTASSASVRILDNVGGAINAGSPLAVVQPFADLVNQPGVAIRVAAGDLNGDGIDEVAVSTAGATQVRVAVIADNPAAAGYAPVSSVISANFDFGIGYLGGAFVAIADIEGGPVRRHELLLSTGNNNPALGNNLTPAVFGSGRIAALSVNFNGTTATIGANLGTFAPTLPGQNGITGLNLAAGHLDDDTFDEVVVGQLRGAQAQGQAYALVTAAGGLDGAVVGTPVQTYNPNSVAANELALGSTRGFFTAIAENRGQTFAPTNVGPPLGTPVADDGTATITFDLTGSRAGRIQDLILDLNLVSPDFNDLDIDLTFTPVGGAAIPIPIIQPGQAADGLPIGRVALGDRFIPRLNGAAPTTGGTVTGNFAPATGNSLLAPGGNSLVGDSARGVWVLTIDDASAADGQTFTVNNAALIVGYGAPGTGDLVSTNTPLGPTTPADTVLTSPILLAAANNGGIVQDVEVEFDVTSAALNNFFRVELVHLAPDGAELARTTLLNSQTVPANATTTRYVVQLNDLYPVNVPLEDADDNAGTIAGAFRGQDGASITAPFRGQYVAGAWQLVVTDTGAAFPLTLNSWGLNVTVR
jgi:hypothetical protein